MPVAAFVGALVLAEIAAHLVDFEVYRLRIGLLDADSNAGVFDWLGTLAPAVATLFAARHAWLSHGRLRWEFGSLAAALAFVTIGSPLDVRDTPAGPYLYAGFLAVIAVLLWRMPADDQSRRLVLIALPCLALSLAIHELGPPILARLGWGPEDWAYQLKIALKQSTQLAGWTLVACALGSGLRLGRGRPAPAAN